MLWIGENHIESNGENGSNDQNFEHEVVECLPEENDPLLGFEWGSVVPPECFFSLFKVVSTKADPYVDLELLCNTVNTYNGNVSDVNNVVCNLPPN